MYCLTRLSSQSKASQCDVRNSLIVTGASGIAAVRFLGM